MKIKKRKNVRRRILITLVIALVFAYYIAVGIIMSYMNVSMLPKIFALMLPSFFLGVAATLLFLDIRFANHIRKNKKSRESGDDNAGNG